MTCNFGYRLEGVPLVKSKSIWYAAPLESKLFALDNESIKMEYNVLMNNFGSKDELLNLKNPAKFFEHIAQNNINYALTSIKETSAFMYCKSNLYPFIVIDKELGKAKYIRRLFDPALGSSILKYIPNDNDDEMVIFTLSAGDWTHAVNRQNIPAEIASQIARREIDEESNCILLFYGERNRSN